MACTVIVVVAPVPQPFWYLIVAVPPIAPPRTTPVATTVATALVLLLQVPPDGLSVRLIVVPVQTEAGPTIVPGVAVTVIVLTAAAPQPVE